jgi:hypothetical protein
VRIALAEAGGQFENPLEASTRGLVKTQLTEEN